MNEKNTLYIVVPCYKEQEVLPETSRRLREKMRQLMDEGKISRRSRVMFVNDGSSDNTWAIISELHEKEPEMFSGVNLSRNRGHQNALLAGLLTLIAFRRQSTGAGWKWARILVYVWLLQNVFLVASSLLRLGKYIAVYSLTELRVAAGLWMLLVACGLCLILWKIWKNRSLNWLVWTNGAALLVLLLFVMLCDIRGHIAEYNLAHCREAVRWDIPRFRRF